jgi:hypothetical protein
VTGRQASTVLWVVAAALFGAALIPASTTCSFWHRGGAIWSGLAVGLAAAAASYLRDPARGPMTALFVSFCVGVAAGVVVFVAVMFAFLAFPGCTA